MSYIGAEPDGMGKAQRFTYTSASGGETVVSADDDGVPIGYTSGQVSVFLNGVKLVVGTDCIATNGSTITGLSALAASDVIEVVALSIFSATTVEGTALISTGETGGSKFLREDGDGTSSWQTVPDQTNVTGTAATVTTAAQPAITSVGTLTGLTVSGINTSASLVLTPGSAPGSPAEGAMYYDSTADAVKVYNGSAWDQLSNDPFTATGGTKTYHGLYTVHSFLSGSTTWTPSTSGNVDILLVAGGGGAGGRFHAGAGGAGGVRQHSAQAVTTIDYTVSVGGGGAGGAASQNVNGTKGTNTFISGTGFTTLTATGGGSGAGYELVGGTGGSGGGGNGGETTSNDTAGAGNEGGYSPVEGYAGAAHTSGTGYHAGGGGGGAGGTGGTSGRVADGGTGIANYWRDGNTSGTTAGIHLFGGGGAGSTSYSSTGHSGAAPTATHGGGIIDSAGANYSGGGGGSVSTSAGAGLAGGGGIVVIRYLT